MKKNNVAFIFIGIGIVIIFFSSLFYFVNKKPKSNKEDNSTNYSFVKSNDNSIKSKVSFIIPNGLKPKESVNNDFKNFYENEKGDFLLAYIVNEQKTVLEYATENFDMNNKIYSNKGYKLKTSDIECKYTCQKYTIYDKDDSLYAEELRIFIKTSPNEMFDLVYHSEKEELSDSMIENIINKLNFSHDATYLIGIVDGEKLRLDFIINDDKNLSIELDNDKYQEIENNNNTSKTTFIKDKETSFVIYLSIEYIEPNKSIKEYINQLYNNDNNEPVDEIELKLQDIVIHNYEFDDYNCYVYVIDDNHILLMEVRYGFLDVNDFNNITVKTKN